MAMVDMPPKRNAAAVAVVVDESDDSEGARSDYLFPEESESENFQPGAVVEVKNAKAKGKATKEEEWGGRRRGEETSSQMKAREERSLRRARSLVLGHQSLIVPMCLGWIGYVCHPSRC